MQEQTKDERPGFIKENDVGTGTLEYMGKIYPYTVVKRGLNPLLPCFVGFASRKHLFISEEAAPAYREQSLAG